jgi:2,4-dienoyl-CoA reductase-like NADH-dependent reductase (Old Yellow Enzyme family)
MSQAQATDRRYRKPRLFEPIAFRGITARNRIMLSPMCQYCAPEAVPHDWHFVHLGSRAAGGAGIVMTEATAVEPRGRISPYDLGLWNDEQEQAFARIAAFVKEQGAVAGMQLAHAGRKASHTRPWEHRQPLTPDQGGWEVVGPSPIPWEPGELTPHELDAAEIAAIVAKFQAAARRAAQAGFDLLEIHAAHGYLLHSFLSPLSNQRTDAYGGGLANRARLLLETVEAVRAVWPADRPLFVRLSVTDWVEGGWTPADTIEVACRLAPLGVDLIDCSSGGSSPDQIVPVAPGYQVPLAEAVRRESGLPTAAVGLISSPQMAEEILANGRADLIILGRVLLWDPYWPHHAASELRAELRLPIQYERAGIYG